MASRTTPITTSAFDEDAKLMKRQEAAQFTGLSAWFVGTHAPYVRVGGRFKRYRRSDLRAWVADLAAKTR